MASINSDVYAIQANAQGLGNGTKTEMGAVRGRERVIRFSVTLAQNVYAINDTVNLFKLPPSSRVIDWKVYSPTVGTTGIFKMGNTASLDGKVVADDDSFGAAYDNSGQALVAVPAPATAPGWMQLFDSECDVVLTWTEATTAANAVVIKGFFTIVQD